MRFSGLLDILKSILARKNNFKEKKAEFLKNADLLLKGKKFIYSGFMDGIFDSSDIYASGREEDFSEKMMMLIMVMTMNFTLQKN